MQHDQDREDFSLELRQLIREGLQADLGGEFSAHADFPYFSVRTQYELGAEIEGLPLYPLDLPPVFLNWAHLDTKVNWQKEDFLVLDLETTGLGRGQTLAFLIGLGYYENDRYVVEQIFLPEPEAEANSFDRLIELTQQKAVLITFNGKTFDLPILESRLLYNHVWLDLRAREHVDLLHLARRLWKNKLPSCALETIEFYILGQIREQELDIDGGIIPQTYFQYLISGETNVLKRVFLHNQLDILHTAALFALICNSAGYPPAQGFDHRIDYHALAKLYLSQGYRDTARAILVDLLAQNILTGDIACELGLLYKKDGDAESAEEAFGLAASLLHPVGMLEFAKALEKRGQLPQALDWAQRLLNWQLSRPLINSAKVAQTELRIRRLQAKLERAARRSN